METPSSGSGGREDPEDEDGSGQVPSGTDATPDRTATSARETPAEPTDGRDPADSRKPARCGACGGVCLCIRDGDGGIVPYGTADCPDCGGSSFEFIAPE